jgi:hypothetical protein
LHARFSYSSVVTAPLEKVWALYSEVNSINKISPPLARVNFARVDLPLRAGSEIVFVGKPPPKIRWHARIEAFVENSHFVDVQVSGPFAHWRHAHLFKAHERGTEMTDRVEFLLKGGRVINLVLTPLVRLLLRAYFAYRHHRTMVLLRN